MSDVFAVSNWMSDTFFWIVSFFASFSFIASFIISVIAIAVVIVIYILLIIVIIRCFGTRTQWSWSRATASTWPAWATLISSTSKVIFVTFAILYFSPFTSFETVSMFTILICAIVHGAMLILECGWCKLYTIWLLQISRPPTMAAISAGIATWWSLLSINFQRKHISAAHKNLMRTSGLFNLI